MLSSYHGNIIKLLLSNVTKFVTLKVHTLGNGHRGQWADLVYIIECHFVSLKTYNASLAHSPYLPLKTGPEESVGMTAA
jgi:hypothetical protein